MKICMIGAVGHNNYVIEGLEQRPGVTVAGIAPGPNEKDVSALSEACKGIGQRPKVFDTYQLMLDQMSPEIVTIACHFSGHARVAVDSISRGHHVFIEKPVATTLPDYERLRAAYGSANVHLSCMLGIRYEPPFMAAWRAVQRGAIGDVRLMTAQKSYKLGTRPDFYCDRETYGGTIPWVGSHAIDWLRWMSGEEFETVFASHSTHANVNYSDLEVTALCHFTLRNDVFGGVSIDYLRPRAAKTHGDDLIRVMGTTGILEVIGDNVILIDDSGEQQLLLEPKRAIFAEFVDQVRGEGECLVTAEDAFSVTRACLLARQSADEKRIISF